MKKSDNTGHVGEHVFELAGLGKAPFRFVGFFEKRGPITTYIDGIEIKVGSPGQPMGTCDYCGTGIAECCKIVSADGKHFVVGTSCVDKTDDAGIIQAYKNSPEFRKMKSDVRHKREEKKIEQVRTLLADSSVRQRLSEIPDTICDWKKQSALDRVEWFMKNAGNAGKCNMLGYINRMLNK